MLLLKLSLYLIQVGHKHEKEIFKKSKLKGILLCADTIPLSYHNNHFEDIYI